MPPRSRSSAHRHRPSLEPASRQPEFISSRDNRWLKSFAAALTGKTSTDGNCIGIEGLRLVEEALRSSITVEAVLVSESGRKHLARFDGRLDSATRVLATTDRLFASVAGTESPQGVAALVIPKRASFDDLLRGPGNPLVLVLAGVQDPGNVGTILRAAEALGASGVATCNIGSLGTAHIFTPKVARASAGAVFRLPIAEGFSSTILLAQLRVAGVRVLAATSSTHAEDAALPWRVDFCRPIAVFIGNEGAGLSAEIEHAADIRVRIPLGAVSGAGTENVESLNAASAAAILLYEATRQRAHAASKPNDESAASKKQAQTSGADS